MLNAMAFVAMFVIGGLSGIFMAATPVDMHIHDTYFIVAHIHYVLFGGSIFGIFAAIYFWYPKMFGRMMNETLGKIHFFLTFIFFNGTFFPMHILGIGGFPRRVADPTIYDVARSTLQPMNLFITHQRLRCWAWRRSSSWSTSLQPVLGPKARPQPVEATRWSGRPRRRRRTATSRRSRSSTTGRTSTPRPARRRTACRRHRLPGRDAGRGWSTMHLTPAAPLMNGNRHRGEPTGVRPRKAPPGARRPRLPEPSTPGPC